MSGSLKHLGTSKLPRWQNAIRRHEHMLKLARTIAALGLAPNILVKRLKDQADAYATQIASTEKSGGSEK